jgi:hypothetical protein
LASSGIDYNIKIWEPKLNEPAEKTNDIEEVKRLVLKLILAK